MTEDMKTKKLTKKQTIVVCLDSSNRMFEEAVILARRGARDAFGIDDDGHAEIKGWHPSDCSLHVELIKFSMVSGMGWEYRFKFKIWCAKLKEE